MPEPTTQDKDFKNINASEYVKNKKIENYSKYHSKFSLDHVKENFIKETGDNDNLYLFKGPTNDILHKNINLPYKIAILKLSTCFYESTKFDLGCHLKMSFILKKNLKIKFKYIGKAIERIWLFF